MGAAPTRGVDAYTKITRKNFIKDKKYGYLHKILRK